MITHYLKVAIRNLLKYKTQNLISIVGLAVGLFCFSVCFYVSRFIGGVDKCFENYERIAKIYMIHPDEKEAISGIVGNTVPVIRQRNWHAAEAFTLLSYSQSKEFAITGSKGEMLPYRLAMIETDSLYKKVFTPTIIAGSWEQASQIKNSVVLTEQAARRLFANTNNAIGQTMTLNTPRYNKTPVTYTVQAVIKDIPANTSISFMKKLDLLVLNDDDGYEHPRAAYMTGYYAYALLREGYTVQQLDQSFKDSNYTVHMFKKDCPVNAKPVGLEKDKATMATIMSIVTSITGLLVLLAASLNFFHLQTGSFLNRGREFGIRKILGNNTAGLFCMLFVQITIVILIATVISGCLVELTAPFMHLSAFMFSIQIEKESLLVHLFQYMGMLLAITALVAACIAWYIRRSTLRATLHGYGKANGKKHLRNTLLGIQFFICWLFVAMAAALYLQSEKTVSSIFDTLTQKEKANIISVSLQHEFLKPEERQLIVDHIQQHAGVMDILTIENDLMSARITSIFDKPNRKEYKYVRITYSSPNYASFLKLGLEGRAIEKENEMVVGRNYADLYEENIIGKTIYTYNKAYTVVGIVDNPNCYVYNDGHGKSNYSNVYFSNNNDFNICYVKCYPEQTKEVQAWIEQKLREIYPASIESKTSTLLDDIKTNQSLENNLKGIILFFSIVCLIITLLGVYSAITLDTERRQKEVAIRKVNGAGLKEIILLFTRLYIWILGISFVLAVPVVYLILQQWKQMYLVFFDDGILYWGGILLSITIITALTVIFHILKIARINPATIIKNE